jgi:iron complex outermembrane receptor protein
MRRSPHCPIPRKLKLCVVLGTLMLPAAVLAQAQPPVAISTAEATRAYNLPTGPMEAVLQQIAASGGRSVQFARADVAKLMAAPVNGQFTPMQAVEAALAGSALTVKAGVSGTLIVDSSIAPQTVSIVAQRNQAETSFKADYSDTTRSGASLHETPQSITIITGKVLETQQATSLQDALRNVSGVAFTQSPQGLPTFSVRGFSQTSTTTNGVSDRGATQTNVFGVERLEVLKGPQAILAGAGSLGGGVNVVMKKPQAELIRDFTFQYGSHNDVTLAGDLSSALTDDKKLTYRIIASGAKASDTTVGYDGREDNFFMPALRWKDAATDVTVGMSYGEQDLPVPAYTFALRDGSILPRPDMLMAAPGDGFSSTQKRLFYELKHTITPWLAFNSRMQRSLNDDLLHLYTPAGLLYPSTAPTALTLGTSNFTPSSNRTLTRSTSGDHYLSAEFDTWKIEHQMAFGYNHVDSNISQNIFNGTRVTVPVFPPSGYQFADAQSSSQVLTSISANTQQQKSFYLQDLMKLGDWNLQLNARRTQIVTGGRTVLPAQNYDQALPHNDQTKTTPGVGVVYNINETTALYASMAQGFAAQLSNLCGGGVAPPQTTRNKEVGAKFDFLDRKVSLTTSLFELDQTNLLQYEAPSRCYVLRDAQQTRGAEVDLQGELARGWSVIANYTWNVYRDTGATGTLFPGLPKHKMSIWSTYDFQGAALKGLGFGLGLNASGHAIGSRTAATQFMLPGQAQIDASVYYRTGKWDLTAGVKNLADRVLYGVSTSNSYVPVLEGRNFMLTARRSFN